MKRIPPAHIRAGGGHWLLPSIAHFTSARIIELGGQADPAPLNCPGTTEKPCVAAVRMTGYQGRASGGPQEPVLHPP